MSTNTQAQKVAPPKIRRLRHRRRLIAGSSIVQGRHPALDNFLIREAARAIASPQRITDPPVVVAGGSDWSVDDLFFIDGGTFSVQAIGQVVTEAAGAVLTVSIVEAGRYTVNPGVGAATTAILPAVGIDLTVTTVLTGAVVGVTEAELLAAIAGVGTSDKNRNIGDTFDIQVSAGYLRGQNSDQLYLDAGVPIA